MRKTNLEQALAELSVTNAVWYVDLRTGDVQEVPTEIHAALSGILAPIIRVRATAADAAQTVAQISRRHTN